MLASAGINLFHYALLIYPWLVIGSDMFMKYNSDYNKQK